jgi:hypothetical protein
MVRPGALTFRRFPVRVSKCPPLEELIEHVGIRTVSVGRQQCSNVNENEIQRSVIKTLHHHLEPRATDKLVTLFARYPQKLAFSVL